MSLIDDIKRDREAGTPGPWRIIIDDDGNPLSGRPMVAASPELDCAIVHWDGFVQTYWRSARGDREIHTNARRIARVPEIEAALIAAEELAEAIDQERNMVCQDMGKQMECAARVDIASAAYRKATGADQ